MASNDQGSPFSVPTPEIFDARRFSNASAFSLATINSVLPAYNAVDPNEPPARNTCRSFSDDATTSQRNQQSTRFDNPTETAVSAPQYSHIKPALMQWKADRPVIDSTGLPETITPHPHEFHYSFPIQSNDAWARLHVYTSDKVPGNPYPSKIQPKVPRIWSCNPIAGMVELDLTNVQTIQQIKLSLKGKLMTSSLNGAVFQFLNHGFTIWQRSFGNPKHINFGGETLQNEKFDGKFIGKYTFPFALPFPCYVDIRNKSAISPSSAFSVTPTPETFTRKPGRLAWLSGSTSSAGTSSSSRSAGTNDRSTSSPVPSPVPPTFVERGISVTVVYELSAVITHGRFKPDSKIKTSISYIPALHPLPASQMRQRAYTFNGNVPGPIQDPTGWFALPKATSVGMFSNNLGQRHVSIDCTLYLAEPLSYTRGGVIPCFLKLSSDDTEALRYLCAPKIPVVRLLQRVCHFNPDHDSDMPDHGALGTFLSLSGPYSPTGSPGAVFDGSTSTFSIIVHEVGMARWWVPFYSDPQGSSVQHLEGEIHLSPDLKPSCSFEVFHVEYIVEMMALHAGDFDAILPDHSMKGNPKSRSIASVPVEITTLHRGDEPIPVAFTEAPKPYTKRVEQPILEDEEANVEQSWHRGLVQIAPLGRGFL